MLNVLLETKMTKNLYFFLISSSKFFGIKVLKNWAIYIKFLKQDINEPNCEFIKVLCFDLQSFFKKQVLVGCLYLFS